MLATVAKIRASCFERLLSQRGFPLLYGSVSGKLLCYGSKCERDAPLLGIIDQHSDVEAESGWQHKDVARLFVRFPGRATMVSNEGWQQDNLLKPKLPKFPRTHTHSLTLSPALFAITLASTLTPAGRALQYRATLPAGLSSVLSVGREHESTWTRSSSYDRPRPKIRYCNLFTSLLPSLGDCYLYDTSTRKGKLNTNYSKIRRSKI